MTMRKRCPICRKQMSTQAKPCGKCKCLAVRFPHLSDRWLRKGHLIEKHDTPCAGCKTLVRDFPHLSHLALRKVRALRHDLPESLWSTPVRQLCVKCLRPSKSDYKPHLRCDGQSYERHEARWHVKCRNRIVHVRIEIQSDCQHHRSDGKHHQLHLRRY